MNKVLFCQQQRSFEFNCEPLKPRLVFGIEDRKELDMP